MSNIIINRVTDPKRSPDAPYGVELLIDTDVNDETVGSSEMAWFKTTAEQTHWFNAWNNEFFHNHERIAVNEFGEFYESCICKNADFFTVINANGEWSEIEPSTQWDGWGCVSCNRVFDDGGFVIAHPKSINWIQ